MVRKIKSYNNFLKHEWISLFVFLVFMALSAGMADYINKTNQAIPSLFEIISEQANDPQMILFPLMYVLLLFTAYGKTTGVNNRTPGVLLKDALHTTAVYMLFFVAANLLYCLVFQDINYIFNNSWSYAGDLSYAQLSPLAAAAVSVMFMFMRSCFTVYLIYFINTLTQKSYWGFWSAFVITYIDYMLYELFIVQHPWGVLPIEHTRIIYTPAAVPDFDHSGIRSPYYVSVLYWIGLIIVVYILLLLIYRKRKRHEEKIS